MARVSQRSWIILVVLPIYALYKKIWSSGVRNDNACVSTNTLEGDLTVPACSSYIVYWEDCLLRINKQMENARITHVIE